MIREIHLQYTVLHVLTVVQGPSWLAEYLQKQSVPANGVFEGLVLSAIWREVYCDWRGAYSHAQL